VQHADVWEQKIGVVLPRFVREGHVFVAWTGGYGRSEPLGSSFHIDQYTAQWKFIPGWKESPAEGPRINYAAQTGLNWEKLANATSLTFDASVDAGPTKCGIVQQGVYGYAQYWSPQALEILTPPESYEGSANGIPVGDCKAADTTYIGAV
jgi:hypothetical protein